jgi:hypothetical protein
MPIKTRGETYLKLPGLVNPLKLDKLCWNCRGEVNKTSDSKEFPYNRNGYCMICDGKGVIPTESGEAILRLIKRHG